MTAIRKLTPLAAVAALAVAAIPAFAATKNVAVKDNVFVPKSITVKTGTTVKWVFKGSKPHNVTVVSGPVKFHSSVKTSGAFTKKLTRKGTYKILCTIHAPDMKMTVKVV